jgi:hypothetical protein
MAKMGGFRNPNGIRKPSIKGPMAAPQKPGKIMSPPTSNGAAAPNMGFKKGGIASKMVGGKRKKK